MCSEKRIKTKSCDMDQQKKSLHYSEQKKQRILELLWLMLINEIAYKEGIIEHSEYFELNAIIKSRCQRERSPRTIDSRFTKSR